MTEQVYYWMGKPISELPREELERLFIEAWKEINDLNGLYLKAKINHIYDLSMMRKRRED